MIDCLGTPPFLNHITGRHSPNRFIFRNIIFSHLRGPKEQFGIHEKLSWEFQVGQIR